MPLRIIPSKSLRYNIFCTQTEYQSSDSEKKLSVSLLNGKVASISLHKHTIISRENNRQPIVSHVFLKRKSILSSPSFSLVSLSRDRGKRRTAGRTATSGNSGV